MSFRFGGREMDGEVRELGRRRKGGGVRGGKIPKARGWAERGDGLFLSLSPPLSLSFSLSLFSAFVFFFFHP